MRFISIFAWTLATVAASPVPESEGGLQERADTCRTNKAYSILSSAGARGSIYCNSVLNLPTSTVPKTAPTPKATVTSCPPGSRPAGRAPGSKREEGSLEGSLLEERQAADGVAGLGGGAITAGCKCLSLAPRTVTSTFTPTATITVNILKQTCTPV